MRGMVGDAMVRRLATTLTVAGILCGSAWAQAGGGAARKDAKADEVIVGLTRYVQGLKNFSVDVEKYENIQMRGIGRTTNETLGFSMARPNRLALVVKRGLMSPTIVCDGKQLSIYEPYRHEYLVEKAPGRMEDFFAPTSMAGAALLQLAPLTDALVASASYEVFMKDVQEATYVGVETIGEEECHHLTFQKDQVNWDLWVTTGDAPLIRRIVPDLKEIVANPASRLEKLDLRWDFVGWQVNEESVEEHFAFKAPAGARKVEGFFQEHPLVGQPAVKFGLEVLQGGKMDLASHFGKDVVVLDFWATWCGPCVAAMPILERVTNALREKGVVYYAVNLRESPSRIRAFMQRKKLKMTVALDLTGRVGDLYGVNGIPMTVIIGRDGRVKKVHEGLAPNMEEQLLRELSGILAAGPAAAAETDLVCKTVRFLPETIKAGQAVTLECVLENLGTKGVAAGSYTISLFIDGEETFVGPVTVAAPASGEALFAIPGEVWQLALAKSGKHTYRLVVDSGDRVTELNENNNALEGVLEVIN